VIAVVADDACAEAKATAEGEPVEAGPSCGELDIAAVGDVILSNAGVVLKEVAGPPEIEFAR